MINVLLTLFALLLAWLRIEGDKSLLFQGVAHVYVGGLAGAFLAGRDRSLAALEVAIPSDQSAPVPDLGRDRYLAALAVALTTVEVVCFLGGR